MNKHCSNLRCDNYHPKNIPHCKKFKLRDIFGCPGYRPARDWVIGDIHPVYGEVQMMGTIGGERYRWFMKNNLVSMIPLSFLDT